MNKLLAIVIPAYKSHFLKETLDSLCKQTCKDFILYIGDDCSPFNIKEIVDTYIDHIQIVYYRFQNNLGKIDLVGQWERCIALSKEPWIWLFSDDDTMDETCVERFYEAIKLFPNQEIFHYNVNVIDQNSNIIKRTRFPKVLSSQDFALGKLKGILNSYVVEYAFSRNIYEKNQGFQKFDLAWNSDDATWIKFGISNGIKTITGACVNWRKSSLNISPQNTNREIVLRKLNANLAYLSWLLTLSFTNKKIRFLISMTTWFMTNLITYRNALSNIEQDKWIRKYCQTINKFYCYPFCKIYIFIKQLLKS